MSDRSIRDAINQITGTHLQDKVYSVEAVVSSVDIASRTCVCQVVSGRANNIMNDVRLMTSAEDGFLIVPGIDSNVCIIISDYTDPYVSQYSAVSKIILRGGDLGGLIAIEALTERLNMLVAHLNIELAKIQTGLTGVGGVYVPAPASQFVKDNYENKSITHG